MGKIKEGMANFKKEATLKENNQEDSTKVMIYHVPNEWIELIRNQGATVSGFTKIAIKEKLQKMGLL